MEQEYERQAERIGIGTMNCPDCASPVSNRAHRFCDQCGSSLRPVPADPLGNERRRSTKGPRTTESEWRGDRIGVEATPAELLAEAIEEAQLLPPGEVNRLVAQIPDPQALYHELVEGRGLSEESVREALHHAFLYPTIDLRVTEVDAGLAAQLGATWLRARLALPLLGSEQSTRLMIALANPTDRETIREIEQLAKRTSSICLSIPSRILERIEQHFAPRLVGILPTGEPVETILDRPETGIGKAAHNRLVITDPTVSSSHALVLAREGAMNLVDLGSSNGTYLNDRKLGRNAHPLQHGDQIKLGRVVLVFRDPGSPTEARTTYLSGATIAAAPLSSSPTDGMERRGDGDRQPPPSPTQSGEPPERKTKSEKRKKQQSDRIKAALLNSTSRILSTILGTVLTLTLAYYVIRPGRPAAIVAQSEVPEIPEKIDEDRSLTGGSRPPSWGTTPPLLPLGTWEKLEGHTRAAPVSVTAVAHRPGSGGLLLVGKAPSHQLHWVPLNPLGRQQSPLFDLSWKASPAVFPSEGLGAPQALTYGNGFYYLLSTTRIKGQREERQQLIRLALSSNGGALRERVEEVEDLARLLRLAPPSPDRVPSPSSTSSRLRINPTRERAGRVISLAWDPVREELLLALPPHPASGEIRLLPIRLIDPVGPFRMENLSISGTPVVSLDLEAETIQAMTFVPQRKSFLLLTRGPSSAHLWEWSGRAGSSPARRMVLDAQQDPQGICAIPLPDSDLIFITGQRGSILRLSSQAVSP